MPEHLMNPSGIRYDSDRGMELNAIEYDIDPSEPTVLLHEDDCIILGVREGDRICISGERSATAIVSVSDTIVQKGTVMVPSSVLSACGGSDGDVVDVSVSHAPESVRHIIEKMDGKTLREDDIIRLVGDVVDGRLSKIETAAWLTALHINGMDIDEIAAYAEGMAESGSMLSFGDRRVFDFHSFGGLPGNKITPIVVSIAVSAGLVMPKLSSRAISSACGTADFVETFCDIGLSSEDVKRISDDVGGVFSWTGSTDLGPAGDIFITIQRPLGIDPRPQMLASIMSKKIAAGATDLVMDIPMGTESKVRTLEAARAYSRDLTDLGERLGVRVECAITYAEQPLGEAVGPILEARECIQVLEGCPGHDDVAEKACVCAGMILDMAGIPDGHRKAREILDSGEAFATFRRIVAAQGGNPEITSSDLVPGAFRADIIASHSGFVRRISNKGVVAVAKAAGAPNDKGAGVMLNKKLGTIVSEGDVMMTVFADREDKLRHAVDKAKCLNPICVEGMVLDRVGPRCVCRTEE